MTHGIDSELYEDLVANMLVDADDLADQMAMEQWIAEQASN